MKIDYTYQLHDIHGELLEEGPDVSKFVKINGFLYRPAFEEQAKYPDAVFTVRPLAGKPMVQYVSRTSYVSPVPDDVTGAAAVSNVRFVGDSATFDSLQEIRSLAAKRAEAYAGQGDLVEFALQVLEIVYKNSKVKE